jgi:hypothetical protein
MADTKVVGAESKADADALVRYLVQLDYPNIRIVGPTSAVESAVNDSTAKFVIIASHQTISEVVAEE